MFPESLIVPIDVFPIGVHETEQLWIGRANDLRDVGVLSALITKGVERPVAVIRPGVLSAPSSVQDLSYIRIPETMNGPRITRARRGTGIPELRL